MGFKEILKAKALAKEWVGNDKYHCKENFKSTSIDTGGGTDSFVRMQSYFFNLWGKNGSA